jgi:hypothetical protein
MWCVNGKFHRKRGPAIEWESGYRTWYISGQYYLGEQVKSVHKIEKWYKRMNQR